MMLLSTNWTEAWAVTGYGIGTVFVILCLLVLVLMAFNAVAGSKAVQKAPEKVNPISAAKRQTGEATTLSEVMGHDEVAIAMSLYMYFNDLHDNESGIITIHHSDEISGWHLQLSN